MSSSYSPLAPAGDARFRTTRWSMVVSAASAESGEAGQDALERLCSDYWYPVYVYIRRSGHGPEEAADLTQGFFARLLEKRDFGTADPERGRFRTYLLAACRHYLANEQDRHRAAKRGGTMRICSLETDDAEARYLHEPRHEQTPEKAYARRWVLDLLERVLTSLQGEFEADNKLELFDALRPTLTLEGGDTPYRDLAIRLGMSESAVKVSGHRLRKRYRELVLLAVSSTVADPGEAREELEFLFEALS